MIIKDRRILDITDRERQLLKQKAIGHGACNGTGILVISQWIHDEELLCWCLTNRLDIDTPKQENTLE